MKKFFKWTLIILLSMAAIGAIFGEDEEETNTEELKAENEEEKKETAEKEEKEKEAAEKKAAEEQAQKDRKEQEEKERKEKEEAEKAAKAEKEKAEKEQAAKEKEKAQAEKEKKEQAEAEKKKQESQKQLENEFLTILEENMTGVARVEFDRENKTYRIYPTDPAMKAVVAGLTQGQYLSEWAMMTEQLRTLGGSAQQFLGDGYSLQMANPANEENILIIILNDKVIYNAVDDL